MPEKKNHKQTDGKELDNDSEPGNLQHKDVAERSVPEVGEPEDKLEMPRSKPHPNPDPADVARDANTPKDKEEPKNDPSNEKVSETKFPSSCDHPDVEPGFGKDIVREADFAAEKKVRDERLKKNVPEPGKSEQPVLRDEVGRRVDELNKALRATPQKAVTEKDKVSCERCGNFDISVHSEKLETGETYTLCSPCFEYAHQEVRNIYR